MIFKQFAKKIRDKFLLNAVRSLFASECSAIYAELNAIKQSVSSELDSLRMTTESAFSGTNEEIKNFVKSELAESKRQLSNDYILGLNTSKLEIAKTIQREVDILKTQFQQSLLAQKDQLNIDTRIIVQQELEPRLAVTVQTIENNRLAVGEYISKFISAAIVNRETFSPYKNLLSGKSLVICGAGPSLKDYRPIPDSIHLALNRAFLFDKVQFDFIYAQDFDGIKMCQKEIIDYKGNNCTKFFGRQYHEIDWIRDKAIPKTLIEKCHAKEFYNDVFYPKDLFDCRFVPDIDSRAVGCMPNIGLGVMQFALFMNPSNIYLVGLDHSGNHFTSSGLSKEEKASEEKFMDSYWEQYLNRSRAKWEECKAFAKVYYPETEIISVNPVGLKGIFKDLYQNDGGK